MAYINHDVSTMAMPSGMNRMGQFPLDMSSVYYDEASLKAYAESGSIAYVGQIVSLVDETNKKVTVYSIQDTAGTLKEVGTLPLGDDKSIKIVDGKITLNDFGKVFYKYVEETGSEEEGNYVAAHYEKTEVSEENPWKAGLEPRVVSEDSQLVIGWYEPNPTTIEGVNNQVTAVEGSVKDLEDSVGTPAGEGQPATGLYKEVEDVNDNVTDLQESIYGTNEDGTPATADNPAEGSIAYDVNELDKLVGLTDATTGLVADMDAAEQDIADIKKEIGTQATDDGGASGIYKVIEEAAANAVKDATYDDTALSGRVKTLEDAGYQNASDVSTAITTALTDYYNAEAIDGKISAIPKFAIEVVTELPTEDISETTVYLVADDDDSTNDLYNEYIYINGAWELLGKASLDLSAYAKTTEVTDITNALDDRLDAVEEDVEALKTTVGNIDVAGDIAEALKDYTNTDGMNTAISNAIDAHNEEVHHLTAGEVYNQIDAKLETANYDNKIATAKQEAIDAAAEAVPVKTVSSEFTLTEEGNLEVKEIAQEKVTGLADAFEAVNNSISDLDAYVGKIPSDEKYADVTNVISYINKKAEETLASANGGSSESAASVAQALDSYKAENDPKVKKNTEDIAAIFSALDTKLEGVKINGVALAITDNVVDIPIATKEALGVVKSSEDENKVSVAADGTMEVNSLNVNKLVQTDGEYLILDGGNASDLPVPEA